MIYSHIHSLCTWHSPTENCVNSGICRKISSVTRCTPRCCGRRLILRWNQAEPICRPRVEDAIVMSVVRTRLWRGRCWQYDRQRVCDRDAPLSPECCVYFILSRLSVWGDVFFKTMRTLVTVNNCFFLVQSVVLYVYYLD